MFKKFKPSSPVKNVVLGQVATHDLDVGKNYKALQYVVTVTKTAATSGFASATLADALGLIVCKVGTVTKRQATATQIDAIQTRWHKNLAVKAYDGVGNDLVTAVPDVVAGGNTTRTTTFVFTLNLAEPARDNFATRDLFSWPTVWASGRKVQISVELTLPANAGIANPVIRANECFDYKLGMVVNGQDVMPITHWYLDPQGYAGLNFLLRDWPYQGVLQQLTVFSPAGSADYVGTVELTGDDDIKVKAAKAELDKLYDVQLVELAIQEEPAIALELHNLFATPNPSAADWQILRDKVLSESFESLAPHAAADLPAEAANGELQPASAPDGTTPAATVSAASQSPPSDSPEVAAVDAPAPFLHPIYGTPV